MANKVQIIRLLSYASLWIKCQFWTELWNTATPKHYETLLYWSLKSMHCSLSVLVDASNAQSDGK